MDPYFFKVRKSEEIDGGSLYLRLIDYCLLVAREQHFLTCQYVLNLFYWRVPQIYRMHCFEMVAIMFDPD